ncbi:MAG TPA: hypothetical protein VG125_25325, partial [Pirellulales bacterium]|nr:hypothetical protein [Pirellulales bacterium]
SPSLPLAKISADQCSYDAVALTPEFFAVREDFGWAGNLPTAIVQAASYFRRSHELGLKLRPPDPLIPPIFGGDGFGPVRRGVLIAKAYPPQLS